MPETASIPESIASPAALPEAGAGASATVDADLERALEGLFRLGANRRFNLRQTLSVGAAVTRAGYAALRSLNDHGTLSVRRLADACAMDAATASRQLMQLVDEGLVERRSADGKRLDLLLCHAEKLYCRNLSTRPASGEVKRRDFWFLANGFVWSSTLPQRDGLAFFDTVGREREALATGEWEAERIEAADEAATFLLVHASRAVARGSMETALLRVSINSGIAPVVLAAESGSGVSVSPTGAALVVATVTPDGSQRHELRALDGKVVASLPPAPAGN